MELDSHNICDLQPEQREAAEKLLGRSLVNFEKVVVKVIEDGNDIVVRFFGGEQPEGAEERPGQSKGNWEVPACFHVLTDLTDEECADYNAVVSEPVTLSRRQ